MVKLNDYIKIDKTKNKKNSFMKNERDYVFVHMQCALYTPQVVIQDINEEYYQIYNYDNININNLNEKN